MAEFSNVIADDKQYVWHHLTQHKMFETVDPAVIVEGKGTRVWNQAGKEHIDAVSGGLWTVNVGYGRESIANAVRDQMVKMNFFSGTVANVPTATFSRALIDKMPGMSRVLYSNSGSEANEKAFKMVRQISHKKHGGRKNKILYRLRDYHGTTIGTMAASGQDQRKAHYGPFPEGFVSVPHCLEYREKEQEDVKRGNTYGVRAANAIEDVILREGPHTVGALILEPITAGGGVILPPEGYWPRVQEICRKYDVLLIIDEVVCGVGRTGAWFGYQHYGIQPDIVTMAKGVASGYAAISCTVTTEKVFDIFKEDSNNPLSYFRDISTFGGCTAGPTAALENMRIIEDENLLSNCQERGEQLLENLRNLKDKHDVIGDVRGKGLLCGFELVECRNSRKPVHESKVQAVVKSCMAQGVIIGCTNRALEGYNNTVVFAPPLVVSEEDIDCITGAVDRALSIVFGAVEF